MKLSFVFLLSIFCMVTKAQVSIFISNETSTPFAVSVNGIVQNNTASEKIIIQDLDTIPYTLHFKIDDSLQRTFSRKLHLHKSGNYQYVITTNFEGKLQLRYRGKTTLFPSDIETISYISSQKPKDSIVAVITPPIKKDSVLAVLPPKIETTKEDSTTTPIDSTLIPTEAIAIEKPTDTLIADSLQTTVALEPPPADTNLFQKDSTHIVTDTIMPIDPFEGFLATLNTAEFEFNKLNLSKAYSEDNKLEIVQILEILKTFSYDNTRLQFIFHIADKISDKENIKLLLNSFEYDLSKKQFIKTYLNE